MNYRQSTNSVYLKWYNAQYKDIGRRKVENPQCSLADRGRGAARVQFHLYLCSFRQRLAKQECIPVGCVQSAVVAIREGGLSQHTLGRGCVSQHVLGRGDVYMGGVCPGVCLPPPVVRMTDACENITFPQLRSGR